MIRQLENDIVACPAVAEPVIENRDVVGRGTRIFMGLFVCAVTAIYFQGFALHGWIPHDEGLLGHTAERVLQGELPHRDFDDVYTGGLAMLHAAAMKLFGLKLASLRWVLWGFSTLFAGASYAIAARAMRPAEAALVALTAAAWSVPNYFAGLPSWYNLFFAVFGIAALLRYVDTGHRRWLFVAGLCGGASLLFKIVGLYFIAAAGLFLVYHQQCRAERESTPRSRAMFPFTLFGAVAATALVASLVRHTGGVMVSTVFIVPAVCLAFLLVANEWRVGRGAPAKRIGRLIGSLAPFACGIALPVAAFLIPYVSSDSLAALRHGVFVLPMKRLDSAVMELPPAVMLLFPAVLFVAAVRLNPRRLQAWHVGLFAVVGAVALLFAKTGWTYHAFWSSMRFCLPLVAATAAWLLLQRGDDRDPSLVRRQEIFLLVAAAVFLNLVQYPFAAPIYFCYVAPAVILAIAFLAASWPGEPRRLRSCWTVLVLAFAVLWLHNCRIATFGFRYERNPTTTLLDLPRGGLNVAESEAQGYAQIIAELEKQTPPGSYIYAAPDCPQFYFLSGRGNPTRTMYDFFDDPTDRAARLIRLWDEKQIAAAVVNEFPEFSDKLDPQLEAELRRRFPQTKRIGPFTLYTRGPDSPLGRSTAGIRRLSLRVPPMTVGDHAVERIAK